MGRSMGNLRVCAYPSGCDTSLAGRHGAAKYCRVHGPEMALKHKRGQGERYRKSTAKPGTRKVYSVNDATPPRIPEKKCSTCGDMPWARRPDRSFDALGSGRQRNGVVHIVAPDWRCVGCGEPYAPEPPIERQEVMQSSMATTIAFGQYYGGEPTRNAYAVPTGRRKGAK